MQEKLELNPPGSDRPYDETFKIVTASLPPLPSVLRYEDDYAGIIRTISNPSSAETWELRVDGKTLRVNWRQFPNSIAPFLRSWLCWHLQKYDGTSSFYRAARARAICIDLPAHIAGMLQPPHIASQYWETSILPWAKNVGHIELLKAILFFLCDTAIGPWTPEHREFVSGLPWGFRQDRFSTIRTGETFLSSVEEAAIITYFDDLNENVRRWPAETPIDTLRDSCSYFTGDISMGSDQFRSQA